MEGRASSPPGQSTIELVVGVFLIVAVVTLGVSLSVRIRAQFKHQFVEPAKISAGAVPQSISDIRFYGTRTLKDLTTGLEGEGWTLKKKIKLEDMTLLLLERKNETTGIFKTSGGEMVVPL